MSTVLSAFTKRTLKEYILPNDNNTDYRIVLDSDVFGTVSDVIINLDVIENRWRVLSGEKYTIIKDERVVDQIQICDNQNFSINCIDGTTVLFIAMTAAADMISTEKLLMTGNSVSIGSGDECDIICKGSRFISKKHAVLSQKRDGWYIEDQSRNGVFLNSVRVNINAKLEFGDYINFSGMRIVFLDNVIAVSLTSEIKVNPRFLKPFEGNEKQAEDKTKKVTNFNRAPRVIDKPFVESVEIEGPPTPKAESERSILSTIGPSFTMAIPMLLGCLLMIYATRRSGSGGVFMFTGLVTAISSGILGAFWGIIHYRDTKGKSAAEEKHRFDTYSDYLLKMAEKIKKMYDKNVDILNRTYPSSEDCCTFDETTSKLWNRNVSHPDFLSHRLGIGSAPFQVEIQIPKEKFSLVDDSLAEKPKMIRDTYKFMKNVPSCVDLAEHCIIGIVGGKGKVGAYDAIKNLSVQIAAGNCYTDVKLAYLIKPDSVDVFSYAKWLPHCWSQDKKTRFFAVGKDEISDACYELAKVFRLRDEMSSDSDLSRKSLPMPHYVLFIDDVSLLEGEALTKYVFDANQKYGLTAILLAENYEQLPNSCECVIYNDGEYTGIYNSATLMELGNNLRFDDVSNEHAEQFARNILHIHVAEVATGGEIPNTLTFLDMYNAETVRQLNALERWKKNRTYDSLKALIGQKSGGTDCYLDIHEKFHGPHGLVAGTTGSGKSETLQTYILSLAVNFSPEDVGFLLIDFKGGGMANLFADLPHLLGRISNLSGNQVRRAMISIKSENKRRQRVFNEHGVNNINAYTRLFKSNEVTEPMPHLFIIIDEFAEMKREQPEFISELISVAQVGRSLGVHLILATQKPGGTVDDNIRSNSRFKLCLRVQDKQDSTEMIGKPDAAYLPHAGRCYLQVGNDEIFELFQSGWSGAVYDESLAGTKINAVQLISDTGKTLVVGSKAVVQSREKAKREWIGSFVKCIDAATVQSGINVSDAASSEERMLSLIDAVFDVFNQMDVEYPVSKNSVKAIQNLIVSEAKCSSGNLNEILSYAAHNHMDLPLPKDQNQLEAVIAYLRAVASENGYNREISLWMQPLPEILDLTLLNGEKAAVCISSSLSVKKWDLCVPVGLFDDPASQSQPVMNVNFSENGHLAVCGNVTSGKSTFLQTLIWSLITKYSPNHVNIYALDFSNHMLQAFESAPHVGAVMSENDEKKIEKFFYMLTQMLTARKNIIRGGDYRQFVKVNGLKMPAVVVTIDNYASFREKTDDKYDSILWELSRDGAGFGIFLALSAGGFGSSGIQSKIADNIKTSISLEMGDKIKYVDILRVSHIDILPETGVKGRGLAFCDGSLLEFQTAVSIKAADDYVRSEMISTMCKKAAAAYKGKTATKVPEIPEKPIWNDLAANEDYQEQLKNSDFLPFAYDEGTATVYSVNLAETFCYVVSGKMRTGRTDTLKVLAASAKEKGGKVYIIDTDEGKLKHFSDKWSDMYVSSQQEIFSFANHLTPEFKKRNAVKNKMLQNGSEESEIYEVMKNEQQIFIFIADTVDFMKKIYSSSEGTGLMNSFFETLFLKGRLHNIYFIFDVNIDEASTLLGRKAYQTVIAYKTGVNLRGSLTSQKIFDLSGIPYNEQAKTLAPGVGHAFSQEGWTKIVIPFSKGL